MQGASEYGGLFKTGQYGRLYLVSGSHARGRTFQVYVLPDSVEAKPNGQHNPPLNKDAVEVYGITGGQPGWTETYGWLHKGKWQDDFASLVEKRKAEIAERETQSMKRKAEADALERQRKADLLSSY